MLYDQLLRSLTGSEGLASGQDYFKWCQAQASAGSRDFAPLDLEAPWPIQRYQAFELLKAFDFPNYLAMKECLQEVADVDRLEADENPPPPPELNEPEVRAEWLQWRNGLIQDYQLEGLVPESQTTSSPESPA